MLPVFRAICLAHGLHRVIYNGEIGASAGDGAPDANAEILSPAGGSPMRCRAVVFANVKANSIMVLVDKPTDGATEVVNERGGVRRRDHR
jgi:hypothetical protein